MAQYIRQQDQEEVERPGSPTSEVLADSAGGGSAVLFVSPSLKYRVRSTSLWHGRSGLEKALAVACLALILTCLVLAIALSSSSRRQGNIQLNLVHPPRRHPPVPENKVCNTPACVTVAAEIIESADMSADPCTDFYQYACGGWLKNNPIPSGKSSWSTFKKLWQDNQNTLRMVLERPPKKEEEGCTACAKARTYYNACLDKNGTLEKLGGTPLLGLLSGFYWNITDYEKGFAGGFDSWTLQNTTEAVQHEYNVGGLFVWAVGEDDKNSSQHVLQLDQGGLTLSSREQYLNKTPDNDTVLAALLEVMVETSMLLFREDKADGEEECGLSDQLHKADVETQMRQVIQFETKLAEITIPASKMRDGENRYNNYTIGKLQEEIKFFNWTSFFQAAFRQINKTITEDEKIILYSPEYLKKLGSLIEEMLKTKEGKNTLNNYLIWQIIKNFDMALSLKYREVDQVLQKVLHGTEVHEERWRTCVTDVDNALGFALGVMFVNETFDEKTKPEAEKMIRLVTKAFRNGLEEADWMDNATRRKAEEKADKITNMIGYPEYIMNNTALEEKYSDLFAEENSYFANSVRFNKWVLRENLRKLSKPVDRTKWGMTPSTINAYYTPLNNQIAFPAGILQAPFFSMARPPSLNFGAMGVVMGHELSHAFDDQGRQYDAEGNMANWWQNGTLDAYKKKIECFKDEYGNFSVEGEHVNGQQTLGENIADNGGLKAAFRAYRELQEGDPTRGTHIFKGSNRGLAEGWSQGDLPGLNLTHNQLFFLSFAQVWCEQATPEAAHLLVMEDAHSPPRLRVIGTLSNSQQFLKEFSCKSDSKMNADKKCSVW